ncbi:MAG: SoxR reducing system RseC family protein [Rhodocyclaceae bacterium]|nr:SoxR reducing system RseC family protein [Rhodocyclaceae bacterium]
MTPINQSCEAVVIRVEGEDAWVDVRDAASCGHCASRHACMSLDASRGPRLHRVPNAIGARAGDAVVLVVPEGALLKAALLSYLVPALMTIAGAAAGAAVGGDVAATMGAGLGLAAGLASLRMAGARLAENREPLLKMRLKCRVSE